jgi:hypothetical protein
MAAAFRASTRCAARGGYQMFGITPMTIYDPCQQASYLSDFLVFFKPGDIVKFNAIDRDEYDRILARVEANDWTPRVAEVEFDLDEFNKDMTGYNAKLMEALDDA